MYIIGRVVTDSGRPQFESYRGGVFDTARGAREYVENNLAPEMGWTAYEAHDILLHLKTKS